MNPEQSTSKNKNNLLIVGIIIGVTTLFWVPIFLVIIISAAYSAGGKSATRDSGVASSYDKSIIRDEKGGIDTSEEVEATEIDENEDVSIEAEEGDVEDNENIPIASNENGGADKETRPENTSSHLFRVISVVDGDTIHLEYEGKDEKVRFIGIDTPEVSDYGGTAECYGAEASSYLKSILNGKWVEMHTDSKTDDRDKYGRLLRYVYLDGVDLGLELILKGYAEEYTYDVSYDKQSQYRQAQTNAKNARNGMWSECMPQSNSQQSPTKQEPKATRPSENSSSASSSGHIYGENGDCNIKGNINKKEKIYHMPGSQSYNTTIIDESAGERWFCTEEEAQAAGWRPRKK